MATHLAIWTALSAARQVSGTTSIEEMAETVEDQIRSGAGDLSITEGQFESVGSFLSEVDNGFEKTGACVLQ